MTARPILTGLIVAAVLLAVAAAMKWAQHAGLIDAVTTLRAWQVLIGLLVAFYGNYIPKKLERTHSVERRRRLQPVLRISGWSFTLAGLAYAGLSLFEPDEIAHLAAMAVIAGAIVITLIAGIRCSSTRSA